MKFDRQKVELNVRAAADDDLLDRMTVYRDGLEPEAIEIIAEELRSRGISWEHLQAHRNERGQTPVLHDRNGLPWQCSLCRQPAVAEGWGWHKLWGRLPVFPRRFRYCRDHQSKA